MLKLEKFPRYPLTFGPTPIEHLPRMSAALGGKVQIYAKRDDCNSGLAMGGNKLRKLEYIVRDDQTQPSVGVDAARRLVDVDAVPAIVGPITSGVTGPILSSVTVEKGVLMVPSASSSPTFSVVAGILRFLLTIDASTPRTVTGRMPPSDASRMPNSAANLTSGGARSMWNFNGKFDWFCSLRPLWSVTSLLSSLPWPCRNGHSAAS